MKDLEGRLKHRVQITTDGHKIYLQAIEESFGSDVDYAILEKIYPPPPQEGPLLSNPGACCETTTRKIMGNPNSARLSTTFSVRQSLSARISIGRFTRLTNAFSRKIENHVFAISIYFMQYNFCRIHQTLRVTPAMEVGIADHVWSLEELVGLLESN